MPLTFVGGRVGLLVGLLRAPQGPINQSCTAGMSRLFFSRAKYEDSLFCAGLIIGNHNWKFCVAEIF